MAGIPESKQKPLLALAGTLAILMSLWTLVRLFRQDMFAAPPVQGLLLFFAPVTVACILGSTLPPRVSRPLLVAGLVLLIGWIIGAAGTAALVLLLLAALSLGDRVGRFGGSGEGTDLYHALIALTLGLAVLALSLTVVSHFPVNGALVYAIALLASAALGWKRLIRYSTALWEWSNDRAKVEIRIWFAAGLFMGATLLTGCYASLFGFTPDTLAMHLYIPSYMATYGHWSYDFQKYLWAVEPMASDMLFGAVYMLSDALGAQLLSATCFVLVAGLIYCVCRRRVDTFDALLAAAAWLCVSYVLYLCGSLHAEGFLSLFLFAAFIHLEAQESATAEPWRPGVIVGLLLAAAVAVKVLALIMAPVYAAFLLLGPGRRHGRVWTLKFLAATAAIVLVAGGFQYGYALAETGNPVFFFYNGLFHSPYYKPVNFLDDHWTGHFGWNLPFDLSFNTQHYSETGSGSAGLQWFMLLPTALICLLPKNAGQIRWYGFAGLWFAVIVLMPEQYLRYMLPAMPFLAVLIAEPARQPGWLLRGIHRTCMLAAIGFNVLALQGTTLRFDDLPADLVFDKSLRDTALETEAPEIAANRMIDRLETGPVNVLYVSRSWGAELRGTAYYQSWYNPELDMAFNHVRTANDVGPILSANRIRYVVVNPAYKHVIKAQEVTDYCRSHGELVATFGPASLYRLGGASP